MNVRLIVLAKSPAPGRSKTRLCPPLTYELAARVAEAALRDTLSAAVASVAGSRPVLALDGIPPRWLPREIDVILQRGAGLDERIAAAFEDVAAPALLIGMDTPQVTPALLGDAMSTLRSPGIDAVLGRALDGGWWAMGLRRPDPGAVLGVPMSTPFTGDAQRVCLDAMGLRCADLPSLQDVDVIQDALAVAAEVPGSRFARTVLASLRAASDLDPVLQ